MKKKKIPRRKRKYNFTTKEGKAWRKSLAVKNALSMMKMYFNQLVEAIEELDK